MDYTVTEYREEFEGQVVDLHALLLNTGRRMSRSYLRWKYDENPFIKPRLFFVVRHGDEVVGMRGLFGTSWTLGSQGETVVLPHADDLIVHPEHRNRGLFLPIHHATVRAARERGFSALLSLSGGENTQKLSLITGWEALGDLERIYRHPLQGPPPGTSSGSRLPFPRRGRRRLREIARRMGHSPGKLVSDRWVDRVHRQMVSTKTESIQISCEADYAGMSSLSESVASGRLRAVRSEAFFRWRLRNPHRKYRFLYWRDSKLRGYMILAWSGAHVDRVMIADYAVVDDGVLSELLDALGQSRSTEHMLMSSTLPHSQQLCARAAGFVPDPTFTKDQRRRFLSFPLTPAGSLGAEKQDSPSYPDIWRVALIDTMAS